MKLGRDFYMGDDAVKIARDLLGKVLFTNIKNNITAGIITETEAYLGVADKASHAYGGRRTLRTETMYQVGGIAYIYLCYGIHSLFNVVTSKQDIPHAVLVRAVKAYKGIDLMLRRRGLSKLTPQAFVGPGKVSQALGIDYSQSGISLLEKKIWIEDLGFKVSDTDIHAGPRIGVDYAAEDALLPYRFMAKDI